MGCGQAHDPQRPGGAPFEEGREQIRTGRRALITTGAGIAFSAAAGSATAAPGRGAQQQGRGRPTRGGTRRTRRAYVLVIDGCRPDELDQGLTPRLQALRDGGLAYPRATSLPVAETIPNHVMMMTGMRPDRTGVPANQVLDLREDVIRDLDRPTDIKVTTIIERMNARGLRTGTVLSKDYLYGIFGERAGRRWEPFPLLPLTDHAPDQATMRAATEMLDDYDPHLMFVNLGDIDRFGHSDPTGPLGLKVLRRTALVDTDVLIGRFVDRLKATGRWESSMVVVLADHSMDWSVPTSTITMTPRLAVDPFLAGRVTVVQNGGAELVYWRGPTDQRTEAVRRIQAVAAGTPGVLEARDRTDPALRLGPEAGDVVLYCQAGWRFSDPQPLLSNPIPGNHGHPATYPIPFFIGGGHPDVARRRSSPALAATVDVAPTVADFFGIRAGRSAYDGTTRLVGTRRQRR